MPATLSSTNYISRNQGASNGGEGGGKGWELPGCSLKQIEVLKTVFADMKT